MVNISQGKSSLIFVVTSLKYGIPIHFELPNQPILWQTLKESRSNLACNPFLSFNTDFLLHTSPVLNLFTLSAILQFAIFNLFQTFATWELIKLSEHARDDRIQSFTIISGYVTWSGWIWINHRTSWKQTPDVQVLWQSRCKKFF